ncbi:hypothetical protein PPROV_000588900 [Pycnococcus provasolii]|uniref:Uncharacterized protein n=1 Tax=Pycnococcus provasolii TaxID=41880 RepID=A0A830HIH4_9CHLO|nr:hypothetical protein PPROV_000588900 [Pycnococcus provasolii]|mmetsp:Transcript_871/g.2302  ORF Transcript_871/g.2302 Transcript_871/m.2302 type:complete len:228 (+) Transcript_871:158-841(+)
MAAPVGVPSSSTDPSVSQKLASLALGGACFGAIAGPVIHTTQRTPRLNLHNPRLVLAGNYAVVGTTFGVMCELMRITADGQKHDVGVSARAGAGTGLLMSGLYENVLRGKLPEHAAQRTLRVSMLFGFVAGAVHLVADTTLKSDMLWDIAASVDLADKRPPHATNEASANVLDRTASLMKDAYASFTSGGWIPAWSPVQVIEKPEADSQHEQRVSGSGFSQRARTRD